MQANQQQQQKQSARKQAVQNPVDTDSQELTLCPNCGAELPAEALYCSECSTMVKQHKCPKCGYANSWNSDICQHCQTWLLEKQCKFCYAELEDGASFCPECGKPKEGIPCPHCGTLSIFDFCTKCGKPVTEEAVAELQTAQAENPPAPADPQTIAMEAELAKLDAVINSMPEPVYAETAYEEPAVEEDYEDVYDPDDYYEEPEIEDEPEVVEEEPVRKSLFSDKQMSSIRQTGDDIDDANRQRAEQARIAEERRREAERLAEERRKEAARLAAEKREAERQAEARRQAAEAQRIAAQQRQQAADAQRAAQQRQQAADAQRAAQQRQQADAQRAANEAERQRQVQQAQAQKEAIQRKMDQDRVASRAAQKDREIAVAKQNASRRFANNQEARNFHNARRHPDAFGWLCNAYSSVHLYSEGGPNNCDEPARGGCDYFGEIKRRKDGYCWVPKDSNL